MRLAVALVALVVACDSRDLLDEAQNLQAQGRFEESLEPLRELIDERPDDAEVQYRYGVALDRAGYPAQAMWALRSAREDSGWAVPAGLALAVAGISAQNWQIAIEATTRVLEAKPDNLRALSLRAEARLGALGEPELALADIERALALDPDHLGLMTAQIRALLLASQIEKAAGVLATLEGRGADALLGKPLLAKLCLAHASLANARGQIEEAMEHFGGCLERYGTEPSVVEGAVSFFDAQGQPGRANELLGLALEQEPKFLRYRKILAGRLRLAGAHDEAEAVLLAGTELGNVPLVTGALALLAEHYIELDDLDAAVAAYARAISMVPEPAPLALLTYADILARAERHEEALAVASRLENEAHRGLIEARVHLNESRPERALARLDEVLLAWPDNPGARYYAARAAEQLGRFDRAVEEYRQSIRSGASASDAGLRLAKLHSAEGNDSGALTAVSHYTKANPREVAGVALFAYLVGRIGPAAEAQLERQLQQLRNNGLRGAALAIRSDLLATLQGPEAALAHIRRVRGVDLADPQNTEALRAFVVYSLAANASSGAAEVLAAALAANESVADFHEIRGVLLEGLEPDTGAARAEYRRALELDAGHVRALEALGRLAEQSGDVDAALAYYDRARDINPDSPTAARSGALLSEAAGRPAEAETHWRALLEEHPWDSEAAMALVRLALERGRAPHPETLALARRAVRFQGGPAAQALLAQVRLAGAPAESTR